MNQKKKKINSLTQDFFPPIGVRLVRVHPFVVLASNPVSHVEAKLFEELLSLLRQPTAALPAFPSAS